MSISSGLPLECPYALLEVPRDATAKEIAKAWRKQALAHHPDKVPDDEKNAAEARFKRVAGAKEILEDPEKRRLYDQHGLSSLDGLPSFPTSCSPFDTEDEFETMTPEEMQEFFRVFMASVSVSTIETPRAVKRSAEDVKDGLLGLAVFGVASLALLACLPCLARWGTWASWHWRFFLHDFGMYGHKHIDI